MQNETHTGWVPRNYTMDPALDTMLFDGTELKVGMLVLIGDPSMRQDERVLDQATDEASREYVIDSLNAVNRWCEVMRVEVQHHPHGFGGHVSLMGRYSDDTMRKRTYAIEYPWLVRKYSIPTEATEATMADVTAILRVVENPDTTA